MTASSADRMTHIVRKTSAEGATGAQGGAWQQNPPLAEERELKSTIMRLASQLRISYGDALRLVNATRIAISKLPCSLLAAWVLRRMMKERFGEVAAVAATTGVLIHSCGRADYDTVIRCAARGCDGVDTQTAHVIAETAREVGATLGLPLDRAAYVSGLLKYQYLNFRVAEPEIRGEGALWGELVAYALQLLEQRGLI